MIEQSFMKSLFHGVIAEELIAPWPEPSNEERDQVAMMLDSIRRFGATIDSAKIDREHEIPPQALQQMKDLGLFGMLIPQEYGGLGLTARAYARITQELAGIDASLA